MENITEVQDVNHLKEVRLQKLAELQKDGKNPFDVYTYDVDTYAKEITGNFEGFEGKVVTIAGRLMSRRLMGKASFCDLLDSSGRIQIYLKQSEIEDAYEEFKKMDIGDIVGISGTVFKTRKEEISVKVQEISLLSKSLEILPEKFHGLTNVDQRYRQRYVDLIVNSDVKTAFLNRSKVIKSIRNYLDEKGYMEVETPVLQTVYGGANAEPFTTHHNTLDIELFLRIALETPLKRLIIGGFDRVYEIGRVFRNEGISTRHNPEFTMLELYRAFVDYNDMMNLTEELVRKAVYDVRGTYKISYEDCDLDLELPFERITMTEAVKIHAGVDFSQITTDEQARAVAKEHGVEFNEYDKIGDVMNSFFEQKAEKKLIQPTFVLDYPVEISPLAKRKRGNSSLVERFELFIVGREYANAFSELNDPLEQRKRFEAQEELKLKGDKEAMPFDEDFLTAMSYGMPPTGGLGIGIDRLVMLITESTSIRDVLFFPTMKPL